MRLTIVIPTYNRSEPLRRTLCGLIPQLTADCRLFILDNCSEVPAAVVVRDTTELHPYSGIEVIRHTSNIGLIGNVMRCFEMCEQGDWLWILGDDDLPAPDAVAQIIRHAGEHPDAAFINFSSELHARTVSRRSVGVEDFIDAVASFSNTLFISAGIYRASFVLAHLPIGYLYGTSMSPHFAMLLAGLGSDGVVVWSQERVAAWEAPPVRGWSFLSLALGLPLLLNFPLSPRSRRTLGKKLLAGIPPLKFYVGELLSLASTPAGLGNARYYYEQLYGGIFRFEPRLLQRAQAWAILWWFRLPRGVGSTTLSLGKRLRRVTRSVRATL